MIILHLGTGLDHPSAFTYYSLTRIIVGPDDGTAVCEPHLEFIENGIMIKWQFFLLHYLRLSSIEQDALSYWTTAISTITVDLMYI